MSNAENITGYASTDAGAAFISHGPVANTTIENANTCQGGWRCKCAGCRELNRQWMEFFNLLYEGGLR